MSGEGVEPSCHVGGAFWERCVCQFHHPDARTNSQPKRARQYRPGCSRRQSFITTSNVPLATAPSSSIDNLSRRSPCIDALGAFWVDGQPLAATHVFLHDSVRGSLVMTAIPFTAVVRRSFR